MTEAEVIAKRMEKKERRKENIFAAKLIGIPILIFTILIGGIIWCNNQREKQSHNLWNDGKCSQCESGHYEFYYTFRDRYDCRMHYFYKCDKCGHAIDLEFNP